MDEKPLLVVKGLNVAVLTVRGYEPVLRGVDLTLNLGETVTLLGESGSGKSMTANAIMGILQVPPFAITGGSVFFDNVDLFALTARERTRVRGEQVSMIFQDSMSALNPCYTVGWQIGEMLRRRRGLSRKAARQRAIALLDRVQIPDARNKVDRFPHEFSGGMRQRVAIAMAIALDPQLLIADEPTTALDVTVQAQVLRLLQDLQSDAGMALLMITHDMGVAYEMSDRVSVMYAGEVIEQASSTVIFDGPLHPYTAGLLSSAPRIDNERGTLSVIEGSPPDIGRIPSGCAYHPRCPFASQFCTVTRPPAVDIRDDHRVLCLCASEMTRVSE